MANCYLCNLKVLTYLHGNILKSVLTTCSQTWVSSTVQQKFWRSHIRNCQNNIFHWIVSRWFKNRCFNCYTQYFAYYFTVSAPLSVGGTTFSPKFSKEEDQKKKKDCLEEHNEFLPWIFARGTFTMFLVKTRLKNKIWLWELHFKGWS